MSKSSSDSSPVTRSYLTSLGSLLAILIALFHLYTAYFGLLSPMIQRSIHLFGTIIICFITDRIWRKKGRLEIVNWVLIAVLFFLAAVLFEALSPEKVLERGISGTSRSEIVLGVFFVLIVLEGTRRSVGLPIVAVACAFLLYGYFGPYMPEFISHKGYSIDRLVSYLVWTTEGIFGLPIAVSSSFIIVFIILGGFLSKLGAGEFFINLALAISGRMKGGPAQTAVVSSALMGSVSGSSVSNVVTTGTFTIPLMIKTGYSPLFAGAVEAVASTGGQIMPPIMGAAAFVMAEMLGISYAQVALAAIIPALLYFVSIGLMVYFEAEKTGLEVQDVGSLPRMGHVLREGFHLLIPLFVLVYLLMVQQFSPMRSGFFTIVTLVIVSSIKLGMRERRFPWREIVSALDLGVKVAVPVALACATAGIVIGVVSLTGLGVRFTQMLLHLSGGILWVAALLTMVACIILGMGLPSTAAYIITAVLGAPALEKFGVPLLAAHMFIFYFAIISFITPPVCISAYAASGIAQTNAMKTGFMSFRLGLAGFIVPFIFIYSPSLLLMGKWSDIILNSMTAILGVAALAACLEGWFFMKLSLWLRGLFAFSAILLIVPHHLSWLIGILPMAGTFLFSRGRGMEAKKVQAG